MGNGVDKMEKQKNRSIRIQKRAIWYKAHRKEQVTETEYDPQSPRERHAASVLYRNRLFMGKGSSCSHLLLSFIVIAFV